jgi:hypothetical protein
MAGRGSSQLSTPCCVNRESQNESKLTILPGSIVPRAQMNVAPLHDPRSSSFAVFPLETCLVWRSAAGPAAASAASERTANCFIVKSEMRLNQISELKSEKIDFGSLVSSAREPHGIRSHCKV